MNITFQDVARLAKTRSPRERVGIAEKVAEGYANGSMSAREKDIAIEIFRVLMRDAEIKVREILSQHLKESSDIPHDVALTLARDVETVAIPMLEFSEVLGETDFATIIRLSRNLGKLSAIARRRYVSYEVSDMLLSMEEPELSSALFRNRNANIHEDSILRQIELMAEEESVIDALIERGGLPLSCVEKMFTATSRHIRERLVERYHVSRHLIEGRLEYAREWATLGAATLGDEKDVGALVRHMQEQRKLTSSVVVRSLCVGDLRFFQHAMGLFAGVPVENVRNLMLDGGVAGFESLYKRSPLPPAYYPAVRKLLDVIFHVTDDGHSTPDDFAKRVVEEIQARGYDKSIEYMPVMLAIIQGNASEFTHLQ